MKTTSKFNLCKAIRGYFSIQPYMDIISWSQKNINFSDDVSAQRSTLDLQLTPHLVDILKQWQFKNKIKEVTVCGIEQHGKSLTWVVGLLYSMCYYPCQSMVVYPSDELSVQNNQTKLKPLMKHIPLLKQQLEKPRSCRNDRYSFSNLTSYFQGSGRKIVSKSCKVRIADQLDVWSSEFKNNLEDLRKRGRSYSESMLWKVCTPTVENGRIWKEFQKSSQGYWTLYCDQCGDWTMRSCDLHNLQFQSQYNEQLKQNIVKKGTCVLICPKCGAQHKEDEKYFMNRSGKYIHKVPERLQLHPGFQFGVLCSLFPFMSWDRIAEKILESGKRSDIEAHMQLDSSWRGLPYKRRQIVKEDFQKIKGHCWKIAEQPSLDNIQMVFMTADTQDNRSVVGVFGLDVNDNLYLLQACQPQYLTLKDQQRTAVNKDREVPVVTVEDMLNKEYLKKNGVGLKPVFCIIDRQGHRSNDVEYFAKRNSQVLMYQGSALHTSNWKMSQNNKRLCLVSAKYYQTSLIYYLYSQKKRGQNYLYFYPSIEDDVIKQIVCVKPDPSKKFGHLPQNWQAENGAQHDFFDVVKMAYFAIDFAIKSFKIDRFRFGKSPMIARRWQKQTKKQEQQQIKSVQSKQSWFDM